MQDTSNEEYNALITTQLLAIDGKKVRAITDYILTGDSTRLSQLEQQASLLRPHVVKEP